MMGKTKTMGGYLQKVYHEQKCYTRAASFTPTAVAAVASFVNSACLLDHLSTTRWTCLILFRLNMSDLDQSATIRDEGAGQNVFLWV